MANLVNLQNKKVFFLCILTSLMFLPLSTPAAESVDIETLTKELHQTSGKEKLKVLSDIVGYYYKISYDETSTYLAQYLALAGENHSLIDQARANYFYSAISFY